MARLVGQKKAREIWFLCRQYNAQEALDMGLVNTVVPYADLEKKLCVGAVKCYVIAQLRYVVESCIECRLRWPIWLTRISG